MAPVPKFVATLLYTIGLWTPETWKPSLPHQQPLDDPLVEEGLVEPVQDGLNWGGPGHGPGHRPPGHGPPGRGPIFQPPNSPEFGEYFCDYSAMDGFLPCSTHEDRGCWLINPLTGESFTIETDYESVSPVGVLREFHLYASEMPLSPDGVLNTDGQVFNQSYPGPPIHACWGDTIRVTVHNNLDQNGTSVHWHGIRQLGTGPMDGVNAVTQCAIAPEEEFTYQFQAIQYGTSWYHSHYSLQYANGLLGPLVIYGPSSANYDTAKDPLLITDWRHMGAFRAWELGFAKQTSQSILVNGVGRYGSTGTLTTIFQKGVRYLFRLINTSVDTTFIWSIDGHWITVIQSDFVPIHPYGTNSVLIGIGQRYNVVVKAAPNFTSPDGNYWMRTVPASGGCARFDSPQPDNRTGVIRYNPFNRDLPSTQMWNFPTACSDEDYSNLVPVLPWDVHWNGTSFDHELVADFSTDTWPPYYPNVSTSRFELATLPLWLNYTGPTLLNLDQDFASQGWLAVVETDNKPETWVVLHINENTKATRGKSKRPLPLAHPIHLHGHDFALLLQSNISYTTMEEIREHVQLNNPPRRDVALLPQNGTLVIAFRPDNPGVWLMHCHIAWHASSGLGAQILENPDRIEIDPQVLSEMDYTCGKWTDWWKKNGGPTYGWQEDSGI